MIANQIHIEQRPNGKYPHGIPVSGNHTGSPSSATGPASTHDAGIPAGNPSTSTSTSTSPSTSPDGIRPCSRYHHQTNPREARTASIVWESGAMKNNSKTVLAVPYTFVIRSSQHRNPRRPARR